MTTPIDITWLQRSFPDLSDFHPLGQGGQKLVLAARHERDGDIVLKIVYIRKTDPESVRREILAVQQIQSPRVPRILEHGLADTNLGLAYGFEKKKYLAIRCATFSPPAAPSRKRAQAWITDDGALEGAERAQIVHRDVKPDNIMRDAVGDFLASGLRHCSPP